MNESASKPALFIVAEQSGQFIVPGKDHSPFENAVDVRAGHLQNVITNLAALSRAQGFVIHDDYQIERELKHAPEGMRRNVENSMPVYIRSAKWAFLKATGLVELAEVLGLPEETAREAVRDEARDMFEDFMIEYFGPENYSEAQKFRRELAATVTRVQLTKQTAENREKGTRIHRHGRLYEKITHESSYLDTLRRMQAIGSDPRAQFIPKTHREKNQVLTFLDYLDNPKYQFGVNSQLMEVFNKAQTDKRKNQDIDPERGPLSITFEIIDYLLNSIEQLEYLQQIQTSVHALANRQATLGDEAEWLDLDHPGFRSLVQYIDLVDFMSGDEVVGARDPLRTRELDRDNSQEKHKTVADIYTSNKRQGNADFMDYLEVRIRKLKAGKAMDSIDAAVHDQVQRGAFMLTLLEDISQHDMQAASYLAVDMLQRPREVAAETVAELQAA